jgi:hypothetical protein
MIVHGFDIYRVYLSAPGDLARERDACWAAITAINESYAISHKILLAPVGLREESQITTTRSAVSENVRECSYFIQIFEDDWGPETLHRKVFYSALDCRDDASLPMREVIVGLKAAPRETDPSILAFRKELEEQPGVRAFHFSKPEEWQAQLTGPLTQWVQAIIESGGGVRAEAS